MGVDPVTATIGSAIVGLIANDQAQKRQQQAIDRQAELRQPAIDFFTGVLSDPNAGVSNLGDLQSGLYGRAESRIEEAIQRAQEAADRDAVRRGIFRSGVAQANQRDIRDSGMDRLADIGTQIDQFGTNLVNQRQQQAAAALANPNLTDPRAAGLIDASQAFQQLGNQLLAQPVGALDTWLNNQWTSLLNRSTPQPTATFVGPIQEAFLPQATRRAMTSGISSSSNLLTAPRFGAALR